MRITRRKAAALILAVPASGAFVRPARAADAVDVAIVLAADISRSINDDEFGLQRQGYAAAITSGQLMEAIHSGPRAAIALCFIEWAGEAEQKVVAEWTVIRSQADAEKFAAALLGAPRSFVGRTARIGARFLDGRDRRERHSCRPVRYRRLGRWNQQSRPTPAYWMKGCSSLGRLRYAVLLGVDGKNGKRPDYCLMDLKEAAKAAAPRAAGVKMPADQESESWRGRATSPHILASECGP